MQGIGKDMQRWRDVRTIPARALCGRSGLFAVGPIFQKVSWLAAKGGAELLERAHLDGLGLAAFQDRHVRYGDADTVSQLGDAHLALGKHDIDVEDDPAAHIVRSLSSWSSAARSTRWERAEAMAAPAMPAQTTRSDSRRTPGWFMPLQKSAMLPARKKRASPAASLAMTAKRCATPEVKACPARIAWAIFQTRARAAKQGVAASQMKASHGIYQPENSG
jgi:hypothetical protein